MSNKVLTSCEDIKQESGDFHLCSCHAMSKKKYIKIYKNRIFYFYKEKISNILYVRAARFHYFPRLYRITHSFETEESLSTTLIHLTLSDHICLYYKKISLKISFHFYLFFFFLFYFLRSDISRFSLV